MKSINRIKVEVALRRPKRKTLNWKNPMEVIVAVYFREFSAKFICQQPRFRSILLKIVAPPSLSKIVSILGRGYRSLTVMRFKFLKSVTIRYLVSHPEALGTR